VTDRVSYAESCRVLQGHGILEGDETPPLPTRAPRHDDEQLGVSFFRSRVSNVDLARLTLPRTFFGRCEIPSLRVSVFEARCSEARTCARRRFAAAHSPIPT
jgi:hypothetical protein